MSCNLKTWNTSVHFGRTWSSWRWVINSLRWFIQILKHRRGAGLWYREDHVSRDIKETVPVRHQAFSFLPQHEQAHQPALYHHHNNRNITIITVTHFNPVSNPHQHFYSALLCNTLCTEQEAHWNDTDTAFRSLSELIGQKSIPASPSPLHRLINTSALTPRIADALRSCHVKTDLHKHTYTHTTIQRKDATAVKSEKAWG